MIGVKMLAAGVLGEMWKVDSINKNVTLKDKSKLTRTFNLH
jgi:hypothetical protein